MKLIRWLTVTLVILLALLFLVGCTSQPLQVAGGPPAFTFSPEILVSVAGAVLSLCFSYIPGLSTWYAGKSDAAKQGLMALLLLSVTGAVFGLSCGGIVSAGIECSRAGIVQVIWIYLLAIMANQSVFKLSPQTHAVLQAKAARVMPATE